MRKSQTSAINIFLLFYIEKFIFCQKTSFEKLCLYDLTFVLQIFHTAGNIENVVIKHQNIHIDMHWFCRRCT